MRINEKFRLNKHIALFGTDQGLYVAILDDNEKINTTLVVTGMVAEIIDTSDVSLKE